MKHLVRMQFTVQAGHDIEARPGGPELAIGRFVERFKPEAVYMSPARREVTMVCDLDAASMAELMIAGSHLIGQYPEFTAVIAAKDFGGVVKQAIPGAMKLMNG